MLELIALNYRKIFEKNFKHKARVLILIPLVSFLVMNIANMLKIVPTNYLLQMKELTLQTALVLILRSFFGLNLIIYIFIGLKSRWEGNKNGKNRNFLFNKTENKKGSYPLVIKIDEDEVGTILENERVIISGLEPSLYTIEILNSRNPLSSINRSNKVKFRSEEGQRILLLNFIF